jgi:hypothetical protein
MTKARLIYVLVMALMLASFLGFGSVLGGKGFADGP